MPNGPLKVVKILKKPKFDPNFKIAIYKGHFKP